MQHKGKRLQKYRQIIKWNAVSKVNFFAKQYNFLFITSKELLQETKKWIIGQKFAYFRGDLSLEKKKMGGDQQRILNNVFDFIW